jgi:hypothetical protein
MSQLGNAHQVIYTNFCIHLLVLLVYEHVNCVSSNLCVAIRARSYPSHVMLRIAGPASELFCIK